MYSDLADEMVTHTKFYDCRGMEVVISVSRDKPKIAFLECSNNY